MASYPDYTLIRCNGSSSSPVAELQVWLMKPVITCHNCLTSGRCQRFSKTTSPSSRIRPWPGSTIQPITLSSILFPEPLGPGSPMTRPECISGEMSRDVSEYGEK
jgi:hypothetical protein